MELTLLTKTLPLTKDTLTLLSLTGLSRESSSKAAASARLSASSPNCQMLPAKCPDSTSMQVLFPGPCDTNESACAQVPYLGVAMLCWNKVDSSCF